jgi:hypothetical protein
VVRPLAVGITDETGRPVEGASVTFHLPEQGPGGAFGNGLNTQVAVTDGRGRATPGPMLVNRTPGRFQIRIVASKEQARAGTISFQYVAETGRAAPAAGHPVQTKAPTDITAKSRHGRVRWIALAVLGSGGAAAAGLLAARGSAARSSDVSHAPAAVVVLTVGTPVVSVGQP